LDSKEHGNASDGGAIVKWIKLVDQLPQERQKLIASDGEYVGEYYYINGGFETDEGYYINATHWMPLPNPPEEENEYDKILQDVLEEGNKRMSENIWMPLRDNASDGGE
jgi:hypothetical protein